MPVLRSALDCLGAAIVIASSITGAAAYTRIAYPPAGQAAAVPWLDPAITGAITNRAAKPAPAGERARSGGGEPARLWIDPPRRRFDFPLRGSI